jgi:hypothetical protein
MCPPVHTNNVQLSQEVKINNIRLHFDMRLTWYKHIFAKWKQLEITLTRMYCLLGRKSWFSTRNKLLIYKTILKPIWTWNTTLGYGFHFQYRNPRMLRSKTLRMIVDAPWYVQNTVIQRNPQSAATVLNIVLASVHTHAATRQQQVTAKTPAKWSAYQIPSVVVVFVLLVLRFSFVSLIPASHKRPWTY